MTSSKGAPPRYEEFIGPRPESEGYVFLSSVYNEASLDTQDYGHLRLRRTIHDIGQEEGMPPVWVAEYAGVDDQMPWTKSLTACLDVLAEASLLIVLLTRRAGSPVRLDCLSAHGDAASSIFEVELFHASQRRIPTVFYTVRGYEHETELAKLIRILRLRDNDNWFVLDENDIERHVRSVLKRAKLGVLPKGWTPIAIADQLSDGKSLPDVKQEIRSSALSFLGQFGLHDRSDFDMQRVGYLLGLAEREVSNVTRLSYLWMAMRDLSIGNALEPGRAQKWGELSQQWPSVAAWLGLHGPLNISASAAYHTQTDLRTRGLLADQDFPYGPYASEYYSMGKACDKPFWRRQRFAGAVQLATMQAEKHSADPSNAIAIRASALLQLARLGRPWLLWDALGDYRQVCRARERSGAGESAVGEAIVESAFAEFQLARFVPILRRNTLVRMREGVDLLDRSTTRSRAGFTVRAKRKYVLALRQAGQRDEAEIQERAAVAIAKRYGVLGQLSQIRRS